MPFCNFVYFLCHKYTCILLCYLVVTILRWIHTVCFWQTGKGQKNAWKQHGLCEVMASFVIVYRQYESAMSDLKEALSLASGHREIQRLLERVQDELEASHLDDNDGQTTKLPDSGVETNSRTLGIPDIVPGTDGNSFDGSEQNDKNAEWMTVLRVHRIFHIHCVSKKRANFDKL